MTDIIKHNQEHPDIRPSQSLMSLVEQYAANPLVQQSQQVTNPQQNPQQPQINLPPNGNAAQLMQQNAGMPAGARTPGQMNMQPPGMPQNFMMASPAMQAGMLPGGMNGSGSPHINLNAANLNPGSNVHTPSPAHVHMQAPAMVQQMSQQGSTGSAASVNTSPNVAGGKRRRQSAVKTEDEGGGMGEVNGVPPKVKQSPRVGGNKRLKNN